MTSLGQLFNASPKRMMSKTVMGLTATRCSVGDLAGDASQLGSTDAKEARLVDRGHHNDVPAVLDTGCSVSVTPFEEDFIAELTPTIRAD